MPDQIKNPVRSLAEDIFTRRISKFGGADVDDDTLAGEAYNAVLDAFVFDTLFADNLSEAERFFRSDFKLTHYRLKDAT